jgi:AcrR family transcriptional regulator
VSAAPDERERLLGAAVELVAEDGYRWASEAAIAKRAGLDDAAFARCFPDREQCVLAAFEQCVARAREQVARACAQRPWEVAVAAAVAVLLELCEREPRWARFVVVESLCCTPSLLRAREAAVAELTRAVDGGRASAPPGRVVGVATAAGLVRSALDLVHERLLGPLLAVDCWSAPLTSMIVLCYRPAGWGSGG